MPILPVGMAVGQHSLTQKLLIFVACQYFNRDRQKSSGKEGNEERCVILVIEVDQMNGFKIVEKKPAIYPEKSQITRIIFNQNYGLIIACYRGHIEHREPNNFTIVNKWSNNMKAIGSEKQKAKASQFEKQQEKEKEFDKFIAEELLKRAIVQGGGTIGQEPSTPGLNGQDTGHRSDVTFQKESEDQFAAAANQKKTKK